MKNLKPKTMRKYFITIAATGALIGLVGAAVEVTALSVIGIVLIMVGIILHIVFYRCPHCGEFLDRSTGDYCPHCGKNVND